MTPIDYAKDYDVVRIYGLVAIFFKYQTEKVGMWFETPNPLLGGVAPDWFLENDRQRTLLKFVENCIDGNFP